MMGQVLENSSIRLAFDEQGRITGFRNKVTGTELLTRPGLEDNWKIMVLTGGYPVHYILGKEQQPVKVTAGEGLVTYRYEGLQRGGQHYAIDLEFSAQLAGEEVHFRVWLRNRGDQRIREVWAPILGGFEGFESGGRRGMVNYAQLYSTPSEDVLHKGLPNAEYLFVVDGETSDTRHSPWIDLFVEEQGLYISSDNRNLDLQTIRLEKYPPEAGGSGGGTDEILMFPPDTERWMKMMVGKMIAVDPGEEWTMPPVFVWPHRGTWYAAADHYRQWMDSWAPWPPRPSWLKDYTGWHHIIGKTYLDEIYFTFEDFTRVMKEANRRSGVGVLMLYGHTDIGCEGANFDLTPGMSLGGPEGFRRMCDELHREGMKVLIFTHRQSAVAMDRAHEWLPFERWAFRDRLGNIRKEEWWKTTIESLAYRNAGTGPIWSRICPYCDEWWEGFLQEIKKLHALGCDGIQMDTIGAEGSVCYAADHGHKPGERMMAKLRDRLAWLRKEVYAMDPEFLLAGEEFGDWMGIYMDLPYSRYREHSGFEIFRYSFPEYKRNVAVGAYSYDQVNKGLMMGWGFNCEVEGLKKSILVCPEFADFVGEVNRLRRKYADTLLNGRYIHTLKAQVEGKVRYGVHQGPQGYAVVVWNQGDDPQPVRVALEEPFDGALLCLPGQEEVRTALPAVFTLQPHSAAVVLARRG